MDGRLKWMLVSLVVVWVLLEALLLAYRTIARRPHGMPPRAALPAGRTGPPAETEKLQEEKAEVLFRETGRFRVNFSKPRDLAVLGNGQILVAGDDGLARLRPDGSVAEDMELPAEPMCLAVDCATNLYIGMMNYILFFPAGSTNGTAWAGPAENTRFTSLCVGPGEILVADYGTRGVWRYDFSGRLIGRFGEGNGGRAPLFVVPTPEFDVAFDGDSLWISNPGRRRIEEYGPEGGLKSVIENTSAGIEGFRGRSNPGHFTLLPDGRIVTSEKGLRRVKIYDADGAFLGMVAPENAFGSGATAPVVATDAEGKVLVLDPVSREITVHAEIRSASRF